MDKPTKTSGPISRLRNKITTWYKQRRFDRAAAVMREFGITPVQFVRVAEGTFIVGHDGLHYRVSDKGSRPSPHHRHVTVTGAGTKTKS